MIWQRNGLHKYRRISIELVAVVTLLGMEELVSRRRCSRKKRPWAIVPSGGVAVSRTVGWCFAERCSDVIRLWEVLMRRDTCLDLHHKIQPRRQCPHTPPSSMKLRWSSIGPSTSSRSPLSFPFVVTARASTLCLDVAAKIHPQTPPRSRRSVVVAGSPTPPSPEQVLFLHHC